MAADGFRSAWEHRQWRALVLSFAVSSIGDWLYFTAFSVWLYQRTGSAGWLAAASSLRLVLYVAGGSVGGRLAARLPRRQLMVWLDLVRMAVMLVLAAVIAADGPPAVAMGLTALSTLATIPYRPAVAAATVSVLPESSLAAGNAAEAIVNQLAVFVGPAVAAALLTGGSAELAVLVDALSFGVSAVLVATVSGAGGGPTASAADEADDAPLGSPWRMVVRGPLGALTALTVLSVFTFGAEGILHVLLADRQIGSGPEFVGAMTAAIGIGGLLAAPLSGRVAASASPGPWLIGCALVQGLPLVLLGFVTSPALALGILVVEGIGVIIFEVLAITLLQRLARERLAEVYGVQDSLTAAGQLAGGLAVPVLLTFTALRATSAITGGVLALFGIAGAGALLRCGRAARPSGELTRRVEELEAIGMFDGLSRAPLERLAGAVVEVTAQDGDVIVAEGDPADAVYVVRAGTVRAESVAGGWLRTMSTGDWFGEIGVLKGVPRTASVVAEGPVELWRLAAPVVQEALLDCPLPVPLAAHMHLRLQSPRHDRRELTDVDS